MSSTQGDLRLLFLLAAIVAALFLKHLPLALPEVRETNAAGEFDTTRAIERLARILGNERPLSVDTAANDAVRERLLAEIEALGFAPEVRDDFSCRSAPSRSRIVCARVQNVIFRAGPSGGDAVMLASHYDSVPAGPGAGDDGIGVAVMLEIAKLLADAPPARSVVFLITDGEEMGLIGAHSFVTTDPIASEIAAVINLEARGVRGPAQMFQTSAPNSADVAAFAGGASRPVANSMMTDVYRLLPNDTDVTEFLPMGYDALNLALTEGVEFYHTPHDSLANLGRRSVQHMGDNALSSVRNFAGAEEASETQVIFADILSRTIVVAPQWLGGAILALGLILAAIAFMRDAGPRPIRALLAPPATLILAGALAYGIQYALGAARPEPQHWLAYPQGMQAVAYFAAALAAVVSLKWIAAGAGRRRLVHAGWFWFAALGAAAWFAAPGASILFALPLAAYAIGAAASLVAPGSMRPLAVIAAILALVMFAPALWLAEIGLGFGMAAVFAFVASVIVMVASPLVAAETMRISYVPVGLAIGCFTAAVSFCLLIPAYSVAKPQPLNIQYYVDAERSEAQWLLSGGGKQAPAPMQAIAAFAAVDVEGLGVRLAAPAPYLETAAPELALRGDEATTGERRVQFTLNMNGADQALIQIPEAAGALRVVANDREEEFGIAGPQNLFCAGRACDGAEFEVILREGEPAAWLIFGVHFGLPYGAWPLVNARPEAATPIQNGDVIIVSARKAL
jgi:hypothetical protein